VSGGNHGIAVAEVASGMDVRATVVMAKTAPPRSIDRIRAAGAELRLTEDMGRRVSRCLTSWWRTGMTLVHPFDDPTVLAGQGTVGLELAEDAPPLTDVLVSIGGGALISGVAVAIKALLPDVRIWGVETEGADAMARALAAGEPVDIAPSSIASTLSAPHVSQLTLDHVRALVEEVFVVPDAEAAAGWWPSPRRPRCGSSRRPAASSRPRAGHRARPRRRLTGLRRVRRQRHPARCPRLVRPPALNREGTTSVVRRAVLRHRVHGLSAVSSGAARRADWPARLLEAVKQDAYQLSLRATRSSRALASELGQFRAAARPGDRGWGRPGQRRLSHAGTTRVWIRIEIRR
jgi:hypothetical protein